MIGVEAEYVLVVLLLLVEILVTSSLADVVLSVGTVEVWTSVSMVGVSGVLMLVSSLTDDSRVED
jgi:hypothetical protein